MKHYESTLATIATQVYRCKTATEAKELIVGHLLTTQVRDRDKMIVEVARMNNLNQIWKYLSNALLRFEGLSLNSYLKER